MKIKSKHIETKSEMDFPTSILKASLAVYRRDVGKLKPLATQYGIEYSAMWRACTGRSRMIYADTFFAIMQALGQVEFKKNKIVIKLKEFEIIE